MDEPDERDKLQQDIEQIHQVLSVDEGDSSDDEGEELLDVDYDPSQDVVLEIDESDETTHNGLTTSSLAGQGYDGDFQHSQQQQQQQPPIHELLLVNHEYQRTIQTLLEQVQQALANNCTEQKDVETQILSAGGTNYDGTAIARKPVARSLVSFFKPYFRDDRGHGPPPNDEAIERRKLLGQDPFIPTKMPWTKKEVKCLHQGVHNDRLRRFQQPLWSRQEILQDKLTNADLEDKERATFEGEMEDLEETIASAQVTAGSRDFQSEKIDWMRISSMDLDGERSPLECELQWNSLQATAINKDRWTTKEDNKLIKLVTKYEARDWETIARELGSSRTAFQCCQHYRVALDPNLVKKSFTQAESDLMLKVANKHRIGNYLPYTKIAHEMDGHSHKQLCMHWILRLDPEIKTGKWSKEEDQALRNAVATYGIKNWATIASEVRGRTTPQVRDRWYAHVCPTVKRGAWSPQEDLKMINLIIEHGLGNWRVVANKMAEGDNQSRSCNSLLIRFRNMVARLKSGNLPKNMKKPKDAVQPSKLPPDIPTDELLLRLQKQKEEQCRLDVIAKEKGKLKEKEKLLRKERKSGRSKKIKSQSEKEPATPTLEDNIIALLKPKTHHGLTKTSKVTRKSRVQNKASVDNKTAYAMLLKVYDVKVKEESRIVQSMLGAPSLRGRPPKTKQAMAMVSTQKSLTNIKHSKHAGVANSGSVMMPNTSQSQPIQSPVATASAPKSLTNIKPTKEATVAKTSGPAIMPKTSNSQPHQSPAIQMLHDMMDQDKADSSSSPVTVKKAAVNQVTVKQSSVKQVVVDQVEVNQGEVNQESDQQAIVKPSEVAPVVIKSSAANEKAVNQVAAESESFEQDSTVKATVSPITSSDIAPHTEEPVEAPTTSATNVQVEEDNDVDMESAGSFDDIGMASVDSDEDIVEQASMDTTIEMSTEIDRTEPEGAGQKQVEIISDFDTLVPTPKKLLSTPIAERLVSVQGSEATQSITSTPHSPQREAVQVKLSSPSGTLTLGSKSTLEASQISTPKASQNLMKPVSASGPGIANSASHSVSVSATSHISSTIINTPVRQMTVPSSSQPQPAPVPVALHMSPRNPVRGATPQLPFVRQLLSVNRENQAFGGAAQSISTLITRPLPVMPQTPPQGQPYPTSIQVANTMASPFTPQSNPLLTQLAGVMQQGGQLQPINSPVGAIQSNALAGNMIANQLQQSMIMVGSAPVVPIFIPGVGQVYGFVPGSMQLAPAGLTSSPVGMNLAQTPSHNPLGVVGMPPIRQAGISQSMVAALQGINAQQMSPRASILQPGILPTGIINAQPMAAPSPLSMVAPSTNISSQLPVTTAQQVSTMRTNTNLLQQITTPIELGTTSTQPSTHAVTGVVPRTVTTPTTFVPMGQGIQLPAVKTTCTQPIFTSQIEQITDCVLPLNETAPVVAQSGIMNQPPAITSGKQHPSVGESAQEITNVQIIGGTSTNRMAAGGKIIPTSASNQPQTGQIETSQYSAQTILAGDNSQETTARMLTEASQRVSSATEGSTDEDLDQENEPLSEIWDVPSEPNAQPSLRCVLPSLSDNQFTSVKPAKKSRIRRKKKSIVNDGGTSLSSCLPSLQGDPTGLSGVLPLLPKAPSSNSNWTVVNVPERLKPDVNNATPSSCASQSLDNVPDSEGDEQNAMKAASIANSASDMDDDPVMDESDYEVSGTVSQEHSTGAEDIPPPIPLTIQCAKDLEQQPMGIGQHVSVNNNQLGVGVMTASNASSNVEQSTPNNSSLGPASQSTVTAQPSLSTYSSPITNQTIVRTQTLQNVQQTVFYPMAQSRNSIQSVTRTVVRPGTSLQPIPTVKPATSVQSHTEKQPIASVLQVSNVKPVGSMQPITTAQLSAKAGERTQVVVTPQVKKGPEKIIRIIKQPNPASNIPKVKMLRPGQPLPPRSSGPVQRFVQPNAPIGQSLRPQVRMLRPMKSSQTVFNLPTISNTVVPYMSHSVTPSQQATLHTGIVQQIVSPAIQQPSLAKPSQIIVNQPTMPGLPQQQILQNVAPFQPVVVRPPLTVMGNPSQTIIYCKPRQVMSQAVPLVQPVAPLHTPLQGQHMPIHVSSGTSLSYSLPSLNSTVDPPPVQRFQLMKSNLMAKIDEMAENLMGTRKDDINKIPLLPPNSANLTALKTLLLHRRTLEKRTSEYNSQKVTKKKFKGYVTRLEQDSESEGGAGEGSHSKSSGNISDQPSLEHILDTPDFKRLQERFMSVFAWPALLSTIPPKEKPKPSGTKRPKGYRRPPAAKSTAESGQRTIERTRKRSAKDANRTTGEIEEPVSKLAKANDESGMQQVITSVPPSAEVMPGS